MCGISGIMAPHGRQAIRPMTEAIAHRGPDACGYYRDERVALGNRRLSIIDLDTGDQPIANETGDLQLVCNGEIYNSPELRRQLEARGHRFKTKTDIEVILHLYEEHGPACVEHLRGMFAFALWDTKRSRLLIARDHMGQKPLFFYQDDQKFLFASEIKALFASGLVPAEMDLTGLWHYVSMRYLPDQYSLFKGVQKLPAGSYLLIENGALRVERYWDIDFAPKLVAPEPEIVEELDRLLLETVEMHLLSDVRVGSFLSGGIDSGLISAMIATVTSAPVPVFSIGVQEQSFNELPFARMVAERYQMEAHERVVEADLVHRLPAMIHCLDEPADPFGAGVYLVAQLAREVVKVVLTGDGGDESFAGYDRFAGQRWLDYYCLLPDWFRREIAARIVRRIPDSFAYNSLAQKALWLNDLSLFAKDEQYAQSLTFLRFTDASKQKLFTASARGAIGDDDSTGKITALFGSDRVDHIVDRMLYTDLMTRMPDHLLVQVDRMCMAHSLEARSPLVDHRVVEFAATIPGDLKLRGVRLKYILKKVAERYLPKELIYRKKQGFAFPLALWLRTDLRELMSNLFAESRFVQLGIFEPGYIRELTEQHVAGRRDHNYRLWILINLELLYRLRCEGQSVAELQADIARWYGGRSSRSSPAVALAGQKERANQ